MLVGLGWIATVIAANGLVSLGAGLEVVPVRDTGPLAEPVGVAVAGGAIALRSGFAMARSVLLPIEAALLYTAGPLLLLLPDALLTAHKSGYVDAQQKQPLDG